MSLVHVTDHQARGAARLSEQFKYQVAIVALLKSWATQVQAIEDAANGLRLARAIETAEGLALDKLGALVGQGREGRTDVQYRIWISGRILVNRSRGKPPQLIGIAAKLGQQRVRFVEYYPAAFIIYLDTPIAGGDGVEIAKLLKIAKAGGVQMQLVWHDTALPFRFSSSGTPDRKSVV